MTTNKVAIIDYNQKIEYKGKVFRFPSILLYAIALMHKRVQLKLDNVLLITGAVGSGKSTLAKGIAGVYEMMFNRELNIDNFTWSSQGIIDFTDNKENETKVIVQDEGIQGMTSRDSITNAGHQLKITLVTKRRMRIFYIILIDELQEYNLKVINRATFLIDTRFQMVDGSPERGYFKIYNSREIKDIYWALKERRMKSIREYLPREKVFYKFYNYENVFFDEDEYEEKKIQETNQQQEDGKIHWSAEKVRAFYLWATTKKTYGELAKEVGVVENTVGKWVRNEFKNFTQPPSIK